MDLIILSTLAFFDYNLIVLVSTGFLNNPMNIAIAGLFFVAGAASWSIALQYIDISYKEKIQLIIIMFLVGVIGVFYAASVASAIHSLFISRIYELVYRAFVSVAVGMIGAYIFLKDKRNRSNYIDRLPTWAALFINIVIYIFLLIYIIYNYKIYIIFFIIYIFFILITHHYLKIEKLKDLITYTSGGILTNITFSLSNSANIFNLDYIFKLFCTLIIGHSTIYLLIIIRIENDFFKNIINSIELTLFSSFIVIYIAIVISPLSMLLPNSILLFLFLIILGLIVIKYKL